MRLFKTDKRLEKITSVIKARQPSLAVILENIHDPHNVSAIFRTCDAVGVPKVGLLYTIESFPQLSKISSSSAVKWVAREKFNDTKKCFNHYREKGFKIFSSLLSEKAINLYDIDLTQKIAFVFGNESRGVSEEAAELADDVSVAAAVTLYEAQRQRLLKGMYEKSEFSKEEIEKFIDEWCRK
jgi:tRNA (guanosine-2'-O-)-methyltransferase